MALGPDEETPPEPRRLDRLDRAEMLVTRSRDLRPANYRSKPPPIILPPVHTERETVRSSWRAMTTRKKISTVVLGVALGLSAAAHLAIRLWGK